MAGPLSIPPIRPWRLISLTRLALALFALIAIYSDPDQPQRYGDTAYLILILYVLASGVLVALSLRAEIRTPFTIFVQGLDIGFFAVLLYATDGPTSPYFVFFLFNLLSATLLWGWRGAAVAAALTTVTYGVMAVATHAEHDPTPVVFRASYQVVAGILFCYFGLLLDRQKVRFASLADWPRLHSDETGRTDLGPLLAHVARIAGSSRVVAAWEDSHEPYLSIARHENGESERHAVPIGEGGLGEMAAIGKPVLCRPEDLPPDLSAFVPEAAVLAPFATSRGRGLLVVSSTPPAPADQLPVITIAAARLANVLEEDLLRQRLVETAAAEARQRLGRDIHDSLLQSLAALALQIKAFERRLPQDAAADLATIRQAISREQEILRHLIGAASAPSEQFRLASVLHAIADGLAGQWRCRIDCIVEPPDAPVRASIADELSFFIAEAVANGVRHGGARRFVISSKLRPDGLELRIRNDGRGIESLRGTFDHLDIARRGLGSRSLLDRAERIGGRIGMTSQPEGFEVALEMPL